MDPLTPKSMTQLSRLKAANSFNSMAALLMTKPSALSYILYKLTPETQYSTFQIPKKNGGTRTISAPTEKLSMIQRKLSMLLQDCWDEIQGAAGRADQISHGFMRGRSILTNAQWHRNRRYVFNLDLQDFFPSINFGRVRGFFISDRNFELHKDTATVIARIACCENSLPQGSPCSPVISNLIAHLMDIHLVRLASKGGCTYTRYADDITFSTNKREFPKEIARCSEAEPHEWLPGSCSGSLER